MVFIGPFSGGNRRLAFCVLLVKSGLKLACARQMQSNMKPFNSGEMRHNKTTCYNAFWQQLVIRCVVENSVWDSRWVKLCCTASLQERKRTLKLAKYASWQTLELPELLEGVNCRNRLQWQVLFTVCGQRHQLPLCHFTW